MSGTGKVVYAVAAAATTINAGFGGEVEYDVSPSFAPIVNAESEATVYLNFNYAGMAIAPYGSTKSTIKLGNLSAENAYFNDSNGSGTGLVPSKVVVAGNVTMNNGWTQTDAFWDNAKTMKFEDFTVDGSFSLIASSARSWGTARSYYYIKSLNGDGSGSITVGQGYSLRIDAVDFAEAPSGTGCIVPLTLTDGPNLSTDGQLHGVNGVLEILPLVKAEKRNSRLQKEGDSGIVVDIRVVFGFPKGHRHEHEPQAQNLFCKRSHGTSLSFPCLLCLLSSSWNLSSCAFRNLFRRWQYSSRFS